MAVLLPAFHEPDQTATMSQSARLACSMARSQLTPMLHSLQVAYLRLGPGQRHYQDTYTTHPWIAREVHTGRRMMLGDSMVRSWACWPSSSKLAHCQCFFTVAWLQCGHASREMYVFMHAGVHMCSNDADSLPCGPGHVDKT